ncbi:hypothetical protein EDC04DRAFT_2999523 [Pisolithus marmoratus]|nr:hypothetical protein EDC04DRAFT_2999523 [Pisolithus marmoratus]
MTSSKFNITPRMLHLQSFNWFKQFAEGAILMDTALDSIEFTLRSNFDHDEWMDLAYCRAFMQKLGIGGSSSGDQESASDIRTSLSLPPAPVPSGETSGDQESAFTGPLLKDPSAWRLMMDWAQDKFGYGKLDDKMRAYGPRYVHEEWKELINEVFMQSDPGAENAIPAPLVVERAMELQGIRLTADSAPAPPLGPSTSDCFNIVPRKSVDEGDDIDEGDDVDDVCEDEEGNGKERSIRYPQQVGPSGKGSFLRTQESVAVRSPIDPQIPAGIFPPPLKNIYIVNFYSASARTFAIEYMKSRELEATTLPVATSPAEGMSIMVFKARQILPTPNWVRIKKSAYKGDLGYVAESTEGKAVMLVAPRQLPYDSLEESGERTRFDVELARVRRPGSSTHPSFLWCRDRLQLRWAPIHSRTAQAAITGRHFGVGRSACILMTSDFTQQLVLTLPQFWRERDIVEVREGDLRGKRGALVNVDWHKRSAVVLCDDDAFECNLHELRRAFSAGDTAEVIAGPFCGERGYVVALHEHTVVLVIMQPDKTSETVEVSRFVVQSHLQEHILSLGPADNALQSAFLLSGDEALPGDVVRAASWPICWPGGNHRVD